MKKNIILFMSHFLSVLNDATMDSLSENLLKHRPKIY